MKSFLASLNDPSKLGPFQGEATPKDAIIFLETECKPLSICMLAMQKNGRETGKLFGFLFFFCFLLDAARRDSAVMEELVKAVGSFSDVEWCRIQRARIISEGVSYTKVSEDAFACVSTGAFEAIQLATSELAKYEGNDRARSMMCGFYVAAELLRSVFAE